MDLGTRHGGNWKISFKGTARSRKGRLLTEFLTQKVKVSFSDIGNALLLQVLRMLISHLASALKILTSMSLSIVSSLFGMTGGVKFTFIWSKLLHLFFPMLVIPQLAQAPTVSLRKCVNFFTFRNGWMARICMGMNGRTLNLKNSKLSLNNIPLRNVNILAYLRRFIGRAWVTCK